MAPPNIELCIPLDDIICMASNAANPDAEADSLAEGDIDSLALSEGDSDADSDRDSLALSEGDSDSDALADSDSDAE